MTWGALTTRELVEYLIYILDQHKGKFHHFKLKYLLRFHKMKMIPPYHRHRFWKDFLQLLGFENTNLRRVGDDYVVKITKKNTREALLKLLGFEAEDVLDL